MADKILGRAGACIYCGARGELCDEHIIAASFAGNLVIEAASCKACADITSALEGKLARGTYHAGRAYYRLPTRRPKDYPTEVDVELWFGNYGPKRTVSVPIEQAPILVMWMNYTEVHPRDPDGTMWSRAQMEAKTLNESTGMTAAIMKKHRAVKLTYSALPIRFDQRFERVLWKFSYGFFWLVDRQSLAASSALDFLLGRRNVKKEVEEALLIQDIYSFKWQGADRPDASAAIFTKPEERHSHLHCELNFFGKLGLPAYVCRIPNVSGQAVFRTEFR